MHKSKIQTFVLLSLTVLALIILPQSAFSSEKVTTSTSGYKISFPAECDVNGLFSSHIGVCPKFATSQKSKELTALLPLFVVVAQKQTSKKMKTAYAEKKADTLDANINKWSKENLHLDAAYFICGSASLVNKIKFKKQEDITVKGGGTGIRISLTCPSDDYGVIGERSAAYQIVQAKSMLYRVGVRYPIDQQTQLAKYRDNFIKSFEVTKPILKITKKKELKHIKK